MVARGDGEFLSEIVGKWRKPRRGSVGVTVAVADSASVEDLCLRGAFEGGGFVYDAGDTLEDLRAEFEKAGVPLVRAPETVLDMAMTLGGLPVFWEAVTGKLGSKK